VKLFSRIRRARPLIFTRFGIFYILFTVGVGAAAINTGNNLLYLVLGIQLSLIVLSGFLSDSSLWGLRVRWHPPASLFVGQRTRWRLEASKGWFPSVLVWVDSTWQEGQAERAWIPWVRKGTTFAATSVQPHRRGWLALQRMRVGTPFPFGLFEKTYFIESTDRWLVYPRLLPLDRIRILEGTDKGQQPIDTTRIGAGSVPFFLRDYQTGDPMRRIHWKSTAKRQRLMVKELEQETAPGERLDLAYWPADLNDSQKEDLISFIASVLWHSVRARQPLGLRTPDRTFAPAVSVSSLMPTLRYLALVQPDPTPAREASGIDALQLWRQYASRR